MRNWVLESWRDNKQYDIKYQENKTTCPNNFGNEVKPMADTHLPGNTEIKKYHIKGILCYVLMMSLKRLYTCNYNYDSNY